MSDDDVPEQSKSNGWLRQIGISLAGPLRDRQELQAVLEQAHEQELLDTDALWMMKGVLSTSELQVRDIMISRSQMVVIPYNACVSDILPVAIRSGHSRFPVVGESRDEVVGLLLAKDLLRYAAAENDTASFRMEEVIRPASYVPETKRVNVLLKEARASRNHMAVVVDEYGGVSGLVTIEDALEQIVGNIDDEYDKTEGGYILRQEKNRFQIRSLTPIDEFNRYFNADFSQQEFDTIGGLVMHAFGHIPRRGETVEVGRFQFNVQQADSRRIRLLQMTLLPEARQ